MEASQASFVPFTVHSDMLDVFVAEFLDGVEDNLVATGVAHGLGGEVAVAAGSVPVSGNGLGVKGYLDTKVFTDPMENVPGHVKLISSTDTFTGSHLELPLTWQNLSIGATNLDASVQACAIVSITDLSAEAIFCTH
jgi:hypothetical protein